ncbi:GYDIA family GHMP kinase [Algibacter pacificus]|uniref:GYDIA family GHMP kinase n=1 Tax=Algibacter pacificus TaxID=2599389 RepID=UPI0011C8241C|nr:GYDIA family GHMP kinase [Algibacter pacificus]
MKQFFSNGKLLISGEYVVLDEAVSLAVPTKYGQSLRIEPIDEPKIIWKSLDEKGTVWFESVFELKNNTILNSNNDEVSNRLRDILIAAKALNPHFLKEELGYKITTKLDFPKNWGLGTSSTLINNMASWAQVDAYVLLEQTFGGSGYDIACAQNNNAITYQLKGDLKAVIPVNFNPKFKENLYFVHLNKKQNSRDGIKHYREHKGDLISSINEINKITQDMLTCESLEVFQKLMERHEAIIAKITKQIPVKERLFSDFKGAIKSLGAWGGDFVLAASNDDVLAYFKAKGFHTVIPYQDMVL